MSRSATPAATVLGIYAVTSFFLFATAASETMLLYPNIFREIPESLELTEQFMTAVAVGDVMRPLGGAILVTALIAIAVSVRYRIGRKWMAASLVTMTGGQFLLSIGFQWPRASILFDDRARYTLAEIESAATEFQVGQYLRLTAAGLSALFAILAALECHRARVLAAAASAKTTRPPSDG
ncbi:hypothetical protein [Nocardia otitidiscaviarum]|uniref:hypothetical protein n=1 Tax=Nocardia otitidiscaviarum TaxID=1823 RepID=UPI001895DE33|nr:hypothetical protein [Nocardia otitidiscaviarum]MBF6178945.1 hypothetical protein [Nocardia otitidiscaviarum]